MDADRKSGCYIMHCRSEKTNTGPTKELFPTLAVAECCDMCRIFFVRNLTRFAAFLACAVASNIVSAQTNSLFGTRGPANQIGTNTTGTAVGRRSTQGTALGGQLGGTTGVSGFGQTAGGAGLGTPRTGFVGRGDNAGRFVGNQLAGQQNVQNRNTRQFSELRNRGGGGFGNNRNQFGGQRGRTRTVVRPRLRVGFTALQRSVMVINSSLSVRFEKLASRDTRLGGVSVSMNGPGVVTLTGEVASLDAKKMAAIMARLEPGVRTVRNELTVSADSSSQP